jgi:hypothetical protein
MDKLFITLFVCLALGGCPKATATQAPPSSTDASPSAGVQADGGIPSCPAGVTETPAAVCATPALFTADNHVCVVCTGGSGCIDHSVEVYCVTSTCGNDPACHQVADSGTATTGSSTAKQRIKKKASKK